MLSTQHKAQLNKNYSKMFTTSINSSLEYQSTSSPCIYHNIKFTLDVISLASCKILIHYYWPKIQRIVVGTYNILMHLNWKKDKKITATESSLFPKSPWPELLILCRLFKRKNHFKCQNFYRSIGFLMYRICVKKQYLFSFAFNCKYFSGIS